MHDVFAVNMSFFTNITMCGIVLLPTPECIMLYGCFEFVRRFCRPVMVQKTPAHLDSVAVSGPISTSHIGRFRYGRQGKNDCPFSVLSSYNAVSMTRAQTTLELNRESTQNT